MEDEESLANVPKVTQSGRGEDKDANSRASDCGGVNGHGEEPLTLVLSLPLCFS